MDYPYILTPKALTVYVEGRSRVVHSENHLFKDIVSALKEKNFEKVLDLIDRSEVINTFGQGKISVKDGVVYYNGTALDNVLCTKILQMKDEGFDVTPMLNFLENLMENPSRNAVQELYVFLEHGNLPITPDGHFLAYKKVNGEFKDFHSGTFDNSPGKILEMPRNQVDDNRDNVCSAGLHFCSLDYLKHYYGNTGKVVILKINPRDVVSIPSDYNNTKGRTCRYEVISEYTGPETEHAFDTSVVDPENYDGDSWGDYGDPYGNDGDSWEDDSDAQEGFDLETEDKAQNIAEMDDEDSQELQGNNIHSAHEHEETVDGGSFKNNIPETEDGSHQKPDHPDTHNDGIPKAVKELVGQIRVRDNSSYQITGVAGPIRNPKGHYTGKWALYVKDSVTGIENVYDMGSILNDKVVQIFTRDLGDGPAGMSLTKDILKLAHEYRKNMEKKDGE